MAKAAKNSALYEYLEPFLASGNEGAIQQARAAYIRQYKAAWRKKQRHSTKQYTVAFSPAEAAKLAIEARSHNMAVTAFIRAAALAYRNKNFIVPDAGQIGLIREVMVANYIELQEIAKGHSLPYNFEKEQLQRMQRLEIKILNALTDPARLRDAITDAIKADPNITNELATLIKTS